MKKYKKWLKKWKTFEILIEFFVETFFSHKSLFQVNLKQKIEEKNVEKKWF